VYVCVCVCVRLSTRRDKKQAERGKAWVRCIRVGACVSKRVAAAGKEGSKHTLKEGSALNPHPPTLHPTPRTLTPNPEPQTAAGRSAGRSRCTGAAGRSAAPSSATHRPNTLAPRPRLPTPAAPRPRWSLVCVCARAGFSGYARWSLAAGQLQA